MTADETQTQEGQNPGGLSDQDGTLWKWLNGRSAAHDILNALRAIARPLGTTPDEREEAARELFTISAKIALEKEAAGEYDFTRSTPHQFLLGIARNVALRQSRERRRHLSADTFTVSEDTGGATAFWEHWIGGDAGFEAALLDRDWLSHLIAGLSEGDQHMVRLGLIQGLTGDELATAMGTTPGAARTRFCRVMKRLSREAQAADVRDQIALRDGTRSR